MDDDQATSYAFHDFLERSCDVRWFGPGELEMELPQSVTLVVEPKEVRRAPAFAYRVPRGPQWIITEQWNHASPQEIRLFYARRELAARNTAPTTRSRVTTIVLGGRIRRVPNVD